MTENEGSGRPTATLGRFLPSPFRVPLRIAAGELAVIASPVRSAINHDVRRTLGLPEGRSGSGRRRFAADPAKAFLPPGAVARRVHSDVPAMVIGGLSALFLQTLHPLVMAGVAEHSDYERDPVGRLRRTADFVARTTFGSADDAARAIRQVRRVHRSVHGVAPDGRAYTAGDPDLVTWVHVAEVSSFLAASRRYGAAALRAHEVEEEDAYLVETGRIAEALGADWVPRSAEEVTAYFGRVRPELYAGPQALAARDFLFRGVAKRPEDRIVYSVIVAAAVGLLPAWARRELRIPTLPLTDTVVVAPLARTLCTGLRWAVGPAMRPEMGPGADHPPGG